ncbi:MAG: RNA polymerase sigma factor [Pirellulaceae bacterium]
MSADPPPDSSELPPVEPGPTRAGAEPRRTGAVSEDGGAQSGGPIGAAEVAALFLTYETDLRRFLQGLLRDRQLASDALQNTFAKMIQRGHEVRAEARRAWLFRVAYHEAMLLRRQSATGDRVLRQAVWGRRDSEAASDDLIIRLEDVARVQAALRELPPEQAQIVRMRIYEEKTFAVIAAELQIPLGTALARMRSALEKLRRQLSSE